MHCWFAAFNRTWLFKFRSINSNHFVIHGLLPNKNFALSFSTTLNYRLLESFFFHLLRCERSRLVFIEYSPFNCETESVMGLFSFQKFSTIIEVYEKKNFWKIKTNFSVAWKKAIGGDGRGWKGEWGIFDMLSKVFNRFVDQHSPRPLLNSISAPNPRLNYQIGRYENSALFKYHRKNLTFPILHTAPHYNE